MYVHELESNVLQTYNYIMTMSNAGPIGET